MNPILKNSDQEKSENYFAHKFLLRVLHLYTVSCLKKKLHSFYWIQMTWILELTSPKRVIILRNFDWFTILKIKNYASFKLFQCLQWVKETLDARLADNKVNKVINNKKLTIKSSTEYLMVSFIVKFEPVVPQIQDFFIVDFDYVSVSCKWTLFICTTYYIILHLRHCCKTICLERM